MKNAFLVLAVVGVFLLGYFLTSWLDRFLNRKKQGASHKKRGNRPFLRSAQEKMI